MVQLSETVVYTEKIYVANKVCIGFFFLLVFGFEMMKKWWWNKYIQQLNHGRAETLHFYCSAEEIDYIVG